MTIVMTKKEKTIGFKEINKKISGKGFFFFFNETTCKYEKI